MSYIQVTSLYPRQCILEWTGAKSSDSSHKFYYHIFKDKAYESPTSDCTAIITLKPNTRHSLQVVAEETNKTRQDTSGVKRLLTDASKPIYITTPQSKNLLKMFNSSMSNKPQNWIFFFYRKTNRFYSRSTYKLSFNNKS